MKETTAGKKRENVGKRSSDKGKSISKTGVGNAENSREHHERHTVNSKKHAGRYDRNNKEHDKTRSGGIMSEKADIIIQKKYEIMFVLILLTALFARLYRFPSVPGDINQDEAFAAYNAFSMLHDHGRDTFGYKFPVYFTAWGSGMNALASYLMVPFIAVMGNTIAAMRLPAVIVNVAALVFLYFVVKKIYDEKTALFIFLFCSAAPWHIMISRWGLESNLAPAFLVLGTGCFIMAAFSNRYYILSAVFYGLALYTYAVVWVILPFIIALQILIYIRLGKINRKSMICFILFIVILGIMAVPAFLFLLVNKGVINEIKTPFMSVPRMLYFRGNEVSISNIKENASNFFSILLTQDDNNTYNSLPFFGICYKITAPFFIAGTVFSIVRSVKDIKDRTMSIHYFTVLYFLGGVFLGITIYPNITRTNVIYFPMIIMTGYFMYYFFDRILAGIMSNKRSDDILFIPVTFVVTLFITFEAFYFGDMGKSINFFRGSAAAVECVSDAESAADKKGTAVNNIYVSGLSYPCLLYLYGEDPEEYRNTVQYTGYPGAFVGVSSFGKFMIDDDIGSESAVPDQNSIYLTDSSVNGTAFQNAIESAGTFEKKEFENYIVYYPR